MTGHPLVSATLSLVALVYLSACDPQLDPSEEDADALDDADELDGTDSSPADLPDDELDELAQVEAVDDDQNVSTCSLGLPYLVVANANTKIGTSSLTLSGVPGDYYHFEANVPQGLDAMLIRHNYSPYYGIYSYTEYNPQFWTSFPTGNGAGFDVTYTAPPGAFPGWEYPIEIELRTLSRDIVCTDNVILWIPRACGNVGYWATGTWPTPGFDGANCFVAGLPPGSQPFIWNNGWYVKPTNGNQCSIGVYDTANCYIGTAPAGRTAFLYNHTMYYTR